MNKRSETVAAKLRCATGRKAGIFIHTMSVDLGILVASEATLVSNSRQYARWSSG
jgi:hypothetical protein